MNKKSQVGVQGCRFGPESSRQTLVSPIFRSGLVPSVALIGILIMGIFSPLRTWVDEFPIPNYIWKCHGSLQQGGRLSLIVADDEIQVIHQEISGSGEAAGRETVTVR